ncbi:MAG: GTP-binding protein [Candidatus Brocadia sp.]|nr:GTP-binding protein [Candidatus Brocadia sp.]
MNVRTPITLITGPLGSGKTTLLRHILDTVSKKIAILMNEFGEIAIDSKIIEGKNIRIAELGGGCVCCSLQGEFEAAVNEVIDKIDPEAIVVETTGVAEPDALVFNIHENIPRVRLDGVVTIADADAMIKYPQLGYTTRTQIQAADTILLNKIDLVTPENLDMLQEKLHQLNNMAPILYTQRTQVDPDLLFGIAREREILQPKHIHQPEFESFSHQTSATLDQSCFEQFADHLNEYVYRAKGFVRFSQGTYLFNFVAGRWELEPFQAEKTKLVFIGKELKSQESKIIGELKRCEI